MPDVSAPDGSYRLFQGDCLDVLKTFPDASVDAVITDPPYGTSENGKDKLNGVTNGVWKTFGEEWDEELPTEWIAAVYRVLRPGGALIAFTDTKRTETLWELCSSVGMHPLQTLFWHKTNPAPNPRKNFASSVEAAVFARKPGKVRNWSGGAFTHNLWTGPSVPGPEKLHPTQKPTPLMSWLCRLVTPVGGVILDPFMGSGSTGVAAQRDGFTFFGIERDPHYFEAATVRMLSREARQQVMF